jgi:hypothetical protein
MEAAQQVALNQSIARLKFDDLQHVAVAALTKCDDQACRLDVLTRTLNQVGAMMPTQVGEGSRVSIALAAGTATGLARGALGEFWGRIATLAPALASAAVGLAASNPNIKAAGYAALAGTVAGEGAVEAFELGQVLRVKMMTPVAKVAPQAQPMAA